MFIDINQRSRNRAQEMQLETFFGQLQHLFVIRLPPSHELGLLTATTHLLAAIRNCVTKPIGSLDMHHYSQMGRLDVVDITCVQCLVGRVKDATGWVVIDRSGSLARAVEAEEVELESD